MKTRLKRVKSSAVVAFSAALVGGCAAMQESEAMSVERTLAAAGFRMKLADTPDRLDHLKTLTQRTLVPHENDGKLYYVYADATYCKCLYTGTEEAYQRYQKLALKQKIARERMDAAEMNEDAAMNWGIWGDWGPGAWY